MRQSYAKFQPDDGTWLRSHRLPAFYFKQIHLRQFHRLLHASAFLLLSVAVAFPAFSSPIKYPLSYSARLVDDTGAPLSGSIDLAVQFYRQAQDGAGLLAQPLLLAGVELDFGIFQVELALSDAEIETLFGDASLQVWIDVSKKDPDGQYRPLPRQRFNFVPYAMHALSAESVPVDGTTLGFDATTGKLQLLTHTWGSPASGKYLTTDDSGALSWVAPPSAPVASVAGKTGAVTLAASDISSGTFDAARIADNAVTSAKIANGSILDADIAATAAIADSKLATISTSGKVAGDAITSGTLSGTSGFAGTGGVYLRSDGSVSDLRLFSDNNTNYLALRAPVGVTTNTTWTLPIGDGTNGQVLSTGGNGSLSWVTPNAGVVSSQWSTSGSHIYYSSGNVGIGTTNPSAKLHVAGNAGADGIMFPDGTLQKTAAVGSGSSQWTTSGNNIYFNAGRVGIGTASPGGIFEVNGGSAAYNTSGNPITLRGQTGWGYGTNGGDILLIPGDKGEGHGWNGKVGIGTATPTGMFEVNGGVAAYTNNGRGIILKAESGNPDWYHGGDIILLPGAQGGNNAWPGKVGIGTSSPTGAFEFNGGTAAYNNNGRAIIFQGQAGNADYRSGGNILLLPGSPGGPNGQMGRVGIGTSSPSYMLHVDGSVAGSGAYNQLSDERYKKDIANIKNSLEKILAIHGVTYKWIDEEKYGSDTQLGVIAQDIEAIVPEVVSTDSEGVKRVRYSDLVPLLIEAFKREHAERIAESAKKDEQILELKAEAEQLKFAFCTKFPDMNFCSK